MTASSGEGLRELVTVMDRLRSPGGCPWDAAQTHASLVPYALEEAYEVAEAIETGDRPGMREELGDLLLQVVFHARVAQEHPDDPFDLDDVARGLVTKLVRRHPHVFGSDAAPDAEAVHVRWEQLKQEEKRRESVLDGIPLAQGALARSQKVVARTRRAGLDDVLAAWDVAVTGGAASGTTADDAGADHTGADHASADDARRIGERLLALVAEADAAGVDAETALRETTRRLESEARRSERSRSGLA